MKQSDLLRKQADMMDMAEKYGICNWRKLVLFKTATGDFINVEVFNNENLDRLCIGDEYKFAIGVVEGKPVFEGDYIYLPNGMRVTAGVDGTPASVFLCSGSWTPPKPKTVMVELLREDAEQMAAWTMHDSLGALRNTTEACRKALEEADKK